MALVECVFHADVYGEIVFLPDVFEGLGEAEVEDPEVWRAAPDVGVLAEGDHGSGVAEEGMGIDGLGVFVGDADMAGPFGAFDEFAGCEIGDALDGVFEAAVDVGEAAVDLDGVVDLPVEIVFPNEDFGGGAIDAEP